MATFEVTTELLVHTTVKVTVEADTKEDAIEIASEQLPSNADEGTSRLWKGTVSLKAPKGVDIKVVRAHHFQQASGGEKARKIA